MNHKQGDLFQISQRWNIFFDLQAEVEVEGQQFTGEKECTSKTGAHQSAASVACTALYTDIDRFLITHLPSEYADIEKFIAGLVESADGRIRKIRPVNERGTYRFEITGSYRYCENVHRHHGVNKIYFIVDPIRRTFYQKCYDPNCQYFRSQSRVITEGQTIAIPAMPENLVDKCPSCLKQMIQNRKIKCKQCEQIFCSQCVSPCYFCFEANHCPKCRKSCLDAHNP